MLNWVDDVLGPLNTDHAPVPIAGLLAPSTAVPVVQIVCGLPALAAVGGALTVIVTSEEEEVQGEFEIVQRSTYDPAPPAGVNVAVLLAVLLNWEVEVLGPLNTDHAPVPLAGLLAASTALPVVQMVWGLPATEVEGGETTVNAAELLEAGHSCVPRGSEVWLVTIA